MSTEMERHAEEMRRRNLRMTLRSSRVSARLYDRYRSREPYTVRQPWQERRAIYLREKGATE